MNIPKANSIMMMSVTGIWLLLSKKVRLQLFHHKHPPFIRVANIFTSLLYKNYIINAYLIAFIDFLLKNVHYFNGRVSNHHQESQPFRSRNSLVG